MPSVEFTGAADASHHPASEGLFDAQSYSDWARGAMRIRAARPDVSLLFDNTIAEPSAELVAVVREAFAGEVTSRYVSVFADGNRFAIEALARRYGLAPGHIVTTTGVTGGLALALKALVPPGDHVLVERPGFDILARLAADAGAQVEAFTRAAPDYRVDLDDLRRRLTPRTRVVMVTNLHNPTGAWLSPAEIRTIAAVADGVGAVLIVDEVYADLAEAEGAPPAAKLGPNILTASSLTKVFGLFALKFGWLTAAPPLLARLRQSAPDGDVGVSKLSHAVAAHVLEHPAPFETHWRGLLAANRPIVRRRVDAMIAAGLVEGDLPPYGCMYFPRIPGVQDSRLLAQRLLDGFDVLVAPGEYFGAPGHIRIGFGADPEAVDRGLTRLQAGLEALTRG